MDDTFAVVAAEYKGLEDCGRSLQLENTEDTLVLFYSSAEV